MQNAEIITERTFNNVRYYKDEALEFLPKLIENLIDYRVENLMYNLEIPEVRDNIDKYNSNLLYLQWYGETIHKDYSDLMEESEESIEHQMIEKAHLVAFLFRDKEVTEIIVKMLMEKGYKVNVLEEPYEDEEYYDETDMFHIIQISWDNNS